MPYIYKRRFLGTQYGKIKDGDIFKISDSAVVVDTDGDITIKEKEFRGSGGRCELLTRKKLYRQHVYSNDLWTYKDILLMTNTHLDGYQARGVINCRGGKTFHEIISLLFAMTEGRVVEWALRRV